MTPAHPPERAGDRRNEADGYPSSQELARMFDEARQMVQMAGLQLETIQRCIVGRLAASEGATPTSETEDA